MLKSLIRHREYTVKRYYLCDIYGDGNIDGENTPTTGPYRPAVADLGVAWVGSIPTGQDGRPLHDWALVLVASNDHAKLRGAKGIDPLPDFPMDGKVSAINQETKVAMKSAMTKRGLPASAIVDGKDGYREVVRTIGQALEPAFDENKFDIADR
jgi:hypothetical protein